MKIFGVGCGRTGTRTLTAMLSDVMSTGHEPDKFDAVAHIMSGNVTLEWLMLREKKLNLDFQSAFFQVYYLEHLITLYPDALFISTIRPFDEWYRSLHTNQQRRQARQRRWTRLKQFFKRSVWNEFRQWRLEKGGGHYDALYQWHYEEVRRVIPHEQLLTIKTTALSQSADRIARFVECQPSDIRQAHEGQTLYAGSTRSASQPGHNM